MDLKADRVTLKKLFGAIGEQFQIPPYQRPYSWEAEQIDDLWDDLISTLDEGHFLGTIVLNTEHDERPQVIDGQQRLITLLILIGLIRDEYHRCNASQAAGWLEQFLIADDYSQGDAKFRLRTGDINWRPFRDLVLRHPEERGRLTLQSISSIPKDIRSRNQALVSNYQRLHSKLDGWLQGLENDQRIRRLKLLENALVGRLQLVAIRVGNVSDAFLLFETLNDRGLQLSAADLLKNHLLARFAETANSDEPVREAALEWDRLIDDLGPTVDVTRYLRHFLLMRSPRVRKDDVYDLFKNEVSRAGPHDLLSQLRIYAKLYGEFEQPGRVDEPEVAQVLDDLKTLRAVSCYTALMPARRHLSSRDFVSFARLAEVLTYRYSTISSLDSKELERVYHRAAKLLDESQGAKLGDARAELQRVMPESPMFMQAFMHQSMGRQYIVRYTLGRIEEVLAENSEKQLRSNSKVHIEHIMPQTLNAEWKESLGARADEHADYVNRWGNLTLLLFRLNAVASNSTFQRKKLEYGKSEVALTRRLCDLPEWNLGAITERQAWLAELADQIWSLGQLEGTSRVRVNTTPPEPLRDLPPSVLHVFLKLVTETSATDALKLVQRVDSHVTALQKSTEDGGSVDLDLAQAIGASLKALARESGALGGTERSWLRGAVDYFALVGDTVRDQEDQGLTDDLAVVNAVCRALGREDLLIRA